MQLFGWLRLSSQLYPHMTQLPTPQGCVAMFRLIFLIMVYPYIRDVFHEQHGEHKILIDGRIDYSTKRIICRPCSLVELVLCYLGIQCRSLKMQSNAGNWEPTGQRLIHTVKLQHFTT